MLAVTNIFELTDFGSQIKRKFNPSVPKYRPLFQKCIDHFLIHTGAVSKLKSRLTHNMMFE